MASQVRRSGAPARSQACSSSIRNTGRRVPSRTGRGVRPLPASRYHWARLMPQTVQGRAVARSLSGTVGCCEVLMPPVWG
jgi:hypothetical protein